MTEKDRQQGGNQSISFVDILEEMNQAGGFTRSVLASSEGLPVASAPENPDMDLASAMIALLQQVSTETQDHLGLEPVDEVIIRTQDRIHLVCRRIPSDSDWLSLCVMVPAGCYYRRVTSQAVNKIRKILES